MQFPEIGPEVILTLQIIVAIMGAYLVAFWLSMAIWAYQDIRSRSRDYFTHFLAVLLVLLFNFAGLVLYLILRPRETLAESYERSLHEEAILQDLEEEMACPSCKNRVEADFLFCPSCLTKLRRPCPHCNRPLKFQWHTCPYCSTTVERQAGTDKPDQEQAPIKKEASLADQE